jgi:hypothetical protein
VNPCAFCDDQAHYAFVPEGVVVVGPNRIGLCRWHLILYYLALRGGGYPGSAVREPQ